MDNIEDINHKIEECLQNKHSSILYLLFHKLRMEEFVDIFFNDVLDESLLDRLFEHRDIWESTYEWLSRNNFFQHYEDPKYKQTIDFVIYRWSQNTPLIWRDLEFVYNTPTRFRDRAESEKFSPVGYLQPLL